jgi:competence protein ComEC
MAGMSSEAPHGSLKAALSGTLAAQIATLPIIWIVIGDVSLTTLPANLLIAPLVSIAFPLAALAGLLGLVWEPLAVVVALPARLCADLVFVVVDALGGSSRTVARVGASSPLVVMLVSTLATVAVLAMSPEVRRWTSRVTARAIAQFAQEPDESRRERGTAD